MKIEGYKVGQRVAIHGFIEAIDIENSMRIDLEDILTLRINIGGKTLNVNPKRAVVDADPYSPKPAVPKFVADWYESNRFNFEDKIWSLIISVNDGTCSDEFSKWFENDYDSIKTLINMRQFGYKVKKEKRYTVSIPNNGGLVILASINNVIKLVDGNKHSHGKFTREEIESAGFGWVFNCSGAKVVEVG